MSDARSWVNAGRRGTTSKWPGLSVLGSLQCAQMLRERAQCAAGRAAQPACIRKPSVGCPRMSSRPRLLFAPLSPRFSASAGLATSRPIRTRQPRAHRTRPAPLQPRRVRLRHRLGSSGSCRIGLGRLLGRARVGSGRRCGWPTCFSARGRRRTAHSRSRLHLPPPIIQGLSWPLQLSSLQRRPPTAALLVRPFTAAIRDVVVRLRTQRLG